MYKTETPDTLPTFSPKRISDESKIHGQIPNKAIDKKFIAGAKNHNKCELAFVKVMKRLYQLTKHCCR
jgi:hypothetical protein